jgi:hypothetical protein
MGRTGAVANAPSRSKYDNFFVMRLVVAGIRVWMRVKGEAWPAELRMMAVMAPFAGVTKR